MIKKIPGFLAVLMAFSLLIRDYLQQPHWLYLDVFANGMTKVGAAAESRRGSRPAEQGPVAAEATAYLATITADQPGTEVFTDPEPWARPACATTVFDAAPVLAHPADLTEGTHHLRVTGAGGPVALGTPGQDWIGTATGAPSQFFRRCLASWMGAEEGEWDWLTFPQTDRVQRMSSLLAAG
ncbi:hypothetical protein ACIRPH_15890 [Nocardiopsis sp. NPDC101807]|uniref:hypothetical protein n=1 Tax=Nocardiopsis sp. NPDC101807 TaxID=3364339 RepID=UPI0038294E37